jgi:DNA invertase Pin-like site-specific DNA recombinase
MCCILAEKSLTAMLSRSLALSKITAHNARVSTQDQNLELQKRELKKAGCKKIYEDVISGKQSDRPGLAMALEMLRKDDTLIVWKLDRLGCNRRLEKKKRGVHF